MTKHFVTEKLRFFLTTPGQCPYLPGQRERKVFTSLDDAQDAIDLNDTLTNAGFRRSQRIAYRPACEACSACVSVRIPVARFSFTRRWRRVAKLNSDLTVELREAQATEEQYWLLRRYLDRRHADGGMADMTMLDYAAMVEESPVRTFLIEYRSRMTGELKAAAMTDLLGDGLSMVYSFYDPDDRRRSLGAFMIVDHVRRAAAAHLAHVYLGYWVRGSEKMDYKAQFRPLEVLGAEGWGDFEPHSGPVRPRSAP